MHHWSEMLTLYWLCGTFAADAEKFAERDGTWTCMWTCEGRVQHRHHICVMAAVVSDQMVWRLRGLGWMQNAAQPRKLQKGRRTCPSSSDQMTSSDTSLPTAVWARYDKTFQQIRPSEYRSLTWELCNFIDNPLFTIKWSNLDLFFLTFLLDMFWVQNIL